MANLAASAVTINRGYVEPRSGGAVTWREYTLVLTGQGGTTNLIPASVLKFSKILEAKPGISASNANMIVAWPNLAGSALLLKASATDAPADFTGTITILVGGNP